MADKLTETVERDIAGESVCGFRVAAYRETHPEFVDQYGHIYSEHWSTPNTRDPRVKVERLFTEDQLRAALSLSNEMREALKPFAAVAEHDIGETEDDSDLFRPMSERNAVAPRITVGDLRRAAALRGSADNGA